MWPKSIEVQLAHGNAGDFWVIGTDLDVPNEESRKKGRRHLNLTDDSEKPLGEWNRMEITCQGDEIVVKVNGVLLNHAENCSVTKGPISLQSEGTPNDEHLLIAFSGAKQRMEVLKVWLDNMDTLLDRETTK